jgi:hypothetical protein
LLPVPVELVVRRIYVIRGQRVMLSPHLAELYQVETRALVQAVKRNPDRFPEDFMFPLSNEEYENLKSQIVISSWGGPRRATPYAFTEHGVAMLSSVLNSKRAVQMNIWIIRAFVKLRGSAGHEPSPGPESRATRSDHQGSRCIVRYRNQRRPGLGQEVYEGDSPPEEPAPAQDQHWLPRPRRKVIPRR